MKHLFLKLLSAKRVDKVVISGQCSWMEVASSMLSQLTARGLTSASSKTIFWRVRCLALCGALGMSGGAAFAKSPVLNPAQLGTFCPPGSELADAKHTNILSAQEQAQIKKSVQGFMALDADARRHGNPQGSSAYWEKGYTTVFNDTKDVPVDGLEYIAFRHQNLCAPKGGVVAVLLLDVAVIDDGTLPKVFADRGAFLSPQSFWDAFTKMPIRFAKPYKDSIPEQPLVFTVLPLFKDDGGRWLIEQRKVPALMKFRKAVWQGHIDNTNLFAQCKSAHKTSQYSPDRCARMEQDKAKLLKLSRPAWSVYPKDMKLGITSHQSIKP